MPGSMDGWALASLMRVSRPELRIVVASGQSLTLLSRDIADAFFVKPYEAERVVKRITELLASREI
jgi:DNA-binding LytR/AlgR family response regulator